MSSKVAAVGLRYQTLMYSVMALGAGISSPCWRMPSRWNFTNQSNARDIHFHFDNAGVDAVYSSAEAFIEHMGGWRPALLR
jgi:hypothetical protein